MAEKRKVYPVSVDMKISITNGESEGTVTYGFPDNIKAADADLDKVMQEVLDQLPEGYRLMTRQEHVMMQLRERGYQGENLAIPNLPKDQEWHDEN